jgi:hypothetical protein
MNKMEQMAILYLFGNYLFWLYLSVSVLVKRNKIYLNKFIIISTLFPKFNVICTKFQIIIVQEKEDNEGNVIKKSHIGILFNQSAHLFYGHKSSLFFFKKIIHYRHQKPPPFMWLRNK